MTIENRIISIRAGVAVADITPHCPVPLCGYPGVGQLATEVHDPLQVSALHLRNGSQPVLLISADLYALDARFISDLRQTIRRQTQIPEKNIMISCTQTHSAPATVNQPAWPDLTVDPDYLETVRNQILHVAARASASTRPVNIAWTTASLANLQKIPSFLPSATDPEVGLLVCRKPEDNRLYAVMIIAALKPAVLDESSRAVSADFPYFLREELKKKYGKELTVFYHTAPCGEQQPEDFGGEHTFLDAENVGRHLADRVSAAIGKLTARDFSAPCKLSSFTSPILLSPRELPSTWDSRLLWGDYQAEYNRLLESKADSTCLHKAARTVREAKSVLDLIRAQGRGELKSLMAYYQTAEVQLLQIGEALIVGLPGELYSGYTRAIRRHMNRRIFTIQQTNGELQGCIPTPETKPSSPLKAMNSLFGPVVGQQLVQAALAAAANGHAVSFQAADCLSPAA